MDNRQDPLPGISIEHAAFFFDVDGTLAALQPSPEMVTIPSHVRKDIFQLSQQCHGALAVISGRPLTQIDQLFAPLQLPAAGVHGAEWRDTHGKVQRTSPDTQSLKQIEQRLEEGVLSLPGVVLEKKRIAFALHYRQARQFSHQTRELAQLMSEQFPGMAVQTGKCVVELKPASIDKGVAIKRFMQEVPFSGRIPVFFGDDMTDERGFKVVNQLQGISVKVGEGRTEARFHLHSTEDVYAWIKQLLNPGIRQSTPLRSVQDGTVSRSF